MFNNIGSKIKSLAIVVTVIGIVVSIIIGLSIIEHSISYGLFTIIIGCFISWVSSFFMYGFGELIEKTSQIAENTEKDTQNK